MSTFSSFARTEEPYFSFVPGIKPPPQASTVHVASGIQLRRLFIDNRDRHESSASPFDFKLFLGNDASRSIGISGYENVLSVELKALAFPKIANERYVILRIDELRDSYLDATCSPAQDAFAIIYFDSDALATGSIKPLKGVDFYQKQLVFRPPLSKLNSLSIKFVKHDGNVVTTSDTGGESNVSLMLEVTSRALRSV